MIISGLILSCNSKNADEHSADEEHMHEENVVHLSEKQFEALGIEIGPLGMRNMNSYVETNGRLTLPPQSEATVTAVIGANVSDIKVIEGDKIKKGQVLAYLSHPDILKLQSEYVKKWSDLDYMKEEYQRQKTLYEEKVNSGREYQKVRSEYISLQSEVKSLESTLELLNIAPKDVLDGKMYKQISLRSPIKGYVRTVQVRIGQYVKPEQQLFEIVDNSHIHAHFLVYEKDIHKVKIGQKVRFTVASMPDQEKEAVIFSVGRVFESDPKAVEIHAEIENEEDVLISGTYCRGRIITDDVKTAAMPEEAVIREGNRKYIFKASRLEGEWEFKPVEVITGIASDSWLEIRLMEDLPENTPFAYNSAYYILSEWKKGEEGHGHSH